MLRLGAATTKSSWFTVERSLWGYLELKTITFANEIEGLCEEEQYNSETTFWECFWLLGFNN